MHPCLTCHTDDDVRLVGPLSRPRVQCAGCGKEAATVAAWNAANPEDVPKSHHAAPRPVYPRGRHPKQTQAEPLRAVRSAYEARGMAMAHAAVRRKRKKPPKPARGACGVCGGKRAPKSKHCATCKIGSKPWETPAARKARVERQKKNLERGEAFGRRERDVHEERGFV